MDLPYLWHHSTRQAWEGMGVTPDQARNALVELSELPAVLAWQEHGNTSQDINDWACKCGLRGPLLDMHRHQWRKTAEAVVDAVLLARATCPTCEGDPHSDPLTEAANLFNLKCPSCGGDPGGLLVLTALGGEKVRYPSTGERRPTWRFPVPSTPDTTP